MKKALFCVLSSILCACQMNPLTTALSRDGSRNERLETIASGVKDQFQIAEFKEAMNSPDQTKTAYRSSQISHIYFNNNEKATERFHEDLYNDPGYAWQIFDHTSQTVIQQLLREKPIFWLGNDRLLLERYKDNVTSHHILNLSSGKYTDVPEQMGPSHTLEYSDETLYFSTHDAIKKLDTQNLQVTEISQRPLDFERFMPLSPRASEGLILAISRHPDTPQGQELFRLKTSPLRYVDYYYLSKSKAPVYLNREANNINEFPFADGFFLCPTGELLLLSADKKSTLFDTDSGEPVLSVEGNALGWLTKDVFLSTDPPYINIYSISNDGAQATQILRLNASYDSLKLLTPSRHLIIRQKEQFMVYDLSDLENIQVKPLLTLPLQDDVIPVSPEDTEHFSFAINGKKKHQLSKLYFYNPLTKTLEARLTLKTTPDQPGDYDLTKGAWLYEKAQ